MYNIHDATVPSGNKFNNKLNSAEFYKKKQKKSTIITSREKEYADDSSVHNIIARACVGDGEGT